MRGTVGAGRKPLAAPNDITVAFFCALVLIIDGSEPPPGAGSVIVKLERTFPSTMGLSHFSFCSAVPTSLRIHVAVIGRHAVDCEWPENRARGFTVNRSPGDDRQVHPAVLLRRLGRPQTGLFCLLAHLGEVFPPGCSHARRNFPDRFRAAAPALPRRRALAGGRSSISGASVKSMRRFPSP